MKMRFEIECTPEEARQLMAVPGLAPVQEQILARARTIMEGGIKPEAVDALVKSWAPMGEVGLTLFRQLMNSSSAPAQPAPPPSTAKS